MIRVTSLAAILASSVLLSTASASAATNLNARIELITSALRNDAQFSARNLSFSLKQGGSEILLFKGIDGARGFNDYEKLNSWMLEKATPKDMFQGGSYKFTHSVLGSYFESPTPAAVPAAPVTPSAFEGAPYTFTHSVLDSYFGAPPEPKIVPQAAYSEPLFQAMMAPPPAIPEPATWAMMISGFAMAGAMLRARKTRLRTA